MLTSQIRHFGLVSPMISSSLLHLGQQNFIGSFHRMPPINLFHYPLCPPDRIRYGSYGCRNPRPAIVLCQLSSGEDAGGDQEHALATFIHIDQRSIFAFSSLDGYTRIGVGIHSLIRDAKHNTRRRVEDRKAVDGIEQRVTSVHPLGD